MVKILAILAWWIFGYGIIELILHDQGRSFYEIASDKASNCNDLENTIVTIAVYIVIPIISPFLVVWTYLTSGVRK